MYMAMYLPLYTMVRARVHVRPSYGKRLVVNRLLPKAMITEKSFCIAKAPGYVTRKFHVTRL
jgi:hypothetical protein